MIMDHILTDSPEKEIWSGVLEIKLSLFKRTSLLKLNEYHEISFRPMENYSHEIFVKKLRSIEFPEYSNHNCVNEAHKDIISKF